tara:strand:- start:1500 stop:1997 length:498 start_codon:yes stop_codon:yes gene_type:complete
MASLNSDDKLNLRNVVSQMGAEDHTEHIRSLKHSTRIRDDVRKLDTLSNKHGVLKETDFEKYVELCKKEAPFLFENYEDLFKRMTKGELDLTIMTKMLVILKLIEDAKVDQHEGSAMFGKVLKELYIDSAIKHGDNLDKQHGVKEEEKKVGKDISYKEFKNLQNK